MLRPENESTAIFCVRSRVQNVLRSPESIARCVVPNLVLQKRSPEYVRRGITYVDSTRTLVEHVRASSKYVVTICVRYQITYARQIRAQRRAPVEYVRQRITYISITSPSYVHRQNTYTRKMRTSRKIRTSVEDVRQQNMYAQVNISEFVLTVVDLPECVPRISISMVVVGTRCTCSDDKRI